MTDEITTKDGKSHTGFRWYDGEVMTTEQTLPDGMIKWNANLIETKAFKELISEGTGLYDLRNRQHTLAFCKITASGQVEQFKHKAEFIRRRMELIEDAPVYTFKDKFVSLFVEHHKNDWGYRPMPRDNMWIEVKLEYGDLLITGIHLHKAYLNEAGQIYQVYSDEIVPPNFTEVGISIFVTGIDKKSQFYNYFTLSKLQRQEDRKKHTKYGCPLCNSPMVDLGNNEIYCDEPQCVRIFQKDVKILYDMNKKKTRNIFRVLDNKEIWKYEDNIRTFVCNLLDFINTPEVVVHATTTREGLEKQNMKRARRGKAPLPLINVIRVTGQLKRYVKGISDRCRGSINFARNEHWVDGHVFRFWDKDKWVRIYGAINKCKTAEEIRNRLAKLVRRDDKGLPQPPYRQYQWDDYYKIIKVWKESYLKFKDEGEQKERIKVLEVD